MKLLLDQNLSRKLVRDLETHFPGTSHVLLLGLDQSSDSEIWYYARHHGFTLVTKNTDMVDLCVVRGGPPSVVWLRLGNCRTEAVREVLQRNTARIEQLERDGRGVLSLFRLFAIEQR